MMKFHKDGQENIHNFILKMFAYLDLLAQMFLNFSAFFLTLYLLVSPADNLCKQIGPRSGTTKCRA